MTDIHLGFTVGSGEPVAIPLNHMVITGQTQMAGKTTCLDALLSRAVGRSAVAFMTKRGEGAFHGARVIAPFFQEQADWRYVAAVLEASRGEKMKFERAWIIRASKGAHTLSDVHRNVRLLMEKAKGMSADMYLVLDAYLDVVVPQIRQIEWARTVDLELGLNVMDLTSLADEMQHLVIRSTIEWVLKHGDRVTVVVPEAWKFIPQGRGTPVKLAAEAYIRQGAGLANYLWLDSQDIAGVEKLILKSVPIWLLGVQRESNEIKRTLAQIPASFNKPKPEQIATLSLGQFFACYGEHTTKVYAKPAWMSTQDAEDIATGKLDVETARRTQRGHQSREVVSLFRPSPAEIKDMETPRPLPAKREADVKESEARELRERNETLVERIDDLSSQLEGALAQLKVYERGVQGQQISERPDVRAIDTPMLNNGDFEALYGQIRDRLAKEAPVILKLLTVKPEIELTVTRTIISPDEHSLKGRIAKLMKDGFFQLGPKGPSAVRAALKRTGPDANTANIGRALDDFTKEGFLTDEGSGYQEVSGMKVRIVGDK